MPIYNITTETYSTLDKKLVLIVLQPEKIIYPTEIKNRINSRSINNVVIFLGSDIIPTAEVQHF